MRATAPPSRRRPASLRLSAHRFHRRRRRPRQWPIPLPRLRLTARLSQEAQEGAYWGNHSCAGLNQAPDTRRGTERRPNEAGSRRRTETDGPAVQVDWGPRTREGQSQPAPPPAPCDPIWVPSLHRRASSVPPDPDSSPSLRTPYPTLPCPPGAPPEPTPGLCSPGRPSLDSYPPLLLYLTEDSQRLFL